MIGSTEDVTDSPVLTGPSSGGETIILARPWGRRCAGLPVFAACLLRAPGSAPGWRAVSSPVPTPSLARGDPLGQHRPDKAAISRPFSSENAWDAPDQNPRRQVGGGRRVGSRLRRNLSLFRKCAGRPDQSPPSADPARAGWSTRNAPTLCPPLPNRAPSIFM